MSEIPDDIAEAVDTLFAGHAGDEEALFAKVCELLLSERKDTLERAARVADAHCECPADCGDVLAERIRALSKAGTE